MKKSKFFTVPYLWGMAGALFVGIGFKNPLAGAELEHYTFFSANWYLLVLIALCAMVLVALELRKGEDESIGIIFRELILSGMIAVFGGVVLGTHLTHLFAGPESSHPFFTWVFATLPKYCFIIFGLVLLVVGQMIEWKRVRAISSTEPEDLIEKYK